MKLAKETKSFQISPNKTKKNRKLKQRMSSKLKHSKRYELMIS